MTIQLRRRKLLQMFAAAGAALPALGLFNPKVSWAATNGIQRVIFLYFPDGVALDRWHPSASSGAIGNLTQPFEPLGAFKDQLTLFRNLNILNGDGDGHGDPFNQFLTGAYDAGGGSADLYIAKKLGGELIHLGVKSQAQSGGYITTYPGGSQKTPEDNPISAFNNYLGRVTTSFSSNAQIAAATTSGDEVDAQLFENALADIETLSPELPSSEKGKLDIHKMGLESELAKIDRNSGGGNNSGNGGSSATCSKYNINDFGFNQSDIFNDKAVPTIMSMHFNTMVHAMACGVSRVGTIQISTHTSSMVMDYEGILLEQGKWAKENHAASHNLPDVHNSMTRWFNMKVAELAGLLKSFPEPTGGGGTMLDHTIICVGSEVASGPAHTRRDMPFYLVGGKGSGVVQSAGKIVDCQNRSHAMLLSAITKAVGAGTFTSAGNLPGVFS